MVGSPIGQVLIQGNIIGPNIREAAGIGAGQGPGITIPDVPATGAIAAPTAATGGVTIGGTTPGSGNVIGNNVQAGILIGGNYDPTGDGPAAVVAVQGNSIGVDGSGTSPCRTAATDRRRHHRHPGHHRRHQSRRGEHDRPQRTGSGSAKSPAGPRSPATRSSPTRLSARPARPRSSALRTPGSPPRS